LYGRLPAALSGRGKPHTVRVGDRPFGPVISGAPGSHGACPSRSSCAEREPDAARETIEEALTRANGVVSNAAAELWMLRQALYRRTERLGIVMERRVK
jgi:transcriptional regulator with GAF, ATPase, and Fis domain